MNIQRTQKLKILITVFALISALCFISSAVFKVSAQGESVFLTLYNPASSIEYFNLNSPKNACYYDGNYAVIEENTIRIFPENGETFVIGEYTGANDDSSTPFSSLKQIKYLDENTLLVLEESNVWTLDNVNDSSSEHTMQSIGGGTFFDFNGNYLIRVSAGTIYINEYSAENGEFAKPITKEAVAHDKYPVAINDNDEIFFFTGTDTNGLLFKNNVSFSDEQLLLNGVQADSITANNDFVYYRNGTRIFSLAVSGGDPVELTSDTVGFELGTFRSPEMLSFKGDNLLIADSEMDAVQEFSVKNDKLVFTGFAIAKGKTAYNRIGGNNVNMERYGDIVAVLDDYKLTLIDTADGQKTFSNYLANDLSDSEQGLTGLPVDFALGNGTALLKYADGSTAIKDFAGEKTLTAIEFEENNANYSISDITYQSGYYYIVTSQLIDNNFNTLFYRIEELGHTATKLISEPVVNDIERNPLIATDVDGNIYAADINGNLIFFDAQNNFAKTPLDAPQNQQIVKLATDLCGDLFALTETSVWHYNGGRVSAEEYILSHDLEGLNADFSSFAMNFDKKEVYFSIDGEETIFVTSALPNAAIDAMAVPDDFAITGESADPDALKVFTPADGKNIYSVTADETYFSFGGLKKEPDELVLISEALGDFYVLGGQTDGNAEIVIVNKKDLEEKNVKSDSPADVAFVATDVSMYYLPILTKNDAFCLREGENVLRLDKKTRLNVRHIAEFLGKEFYFAEIDVNGKTVGGYVPVNFTALRLSEDFIREDFSFVTVDAVPVTDENGNTVYNLKDGETVKFYSEKDGIAYVSYLADGSWENGFIPGSAIRHVPDTTIRNVIIILLVTLSVCVTGIYFIMKKKNGEL